MLAWGVFFYLEKVSRFSHKRAWQPFALWALSGLAFTGIFLIIGKSISIDIPFFHVTVETFNYYDDLEKSLKNIATTTTWIAVFMIIIKALFEEILKLGLLRFYKRKSHYISNMRMSIYAILFIALWFATTESIMIIAFNSSFQSLPLSAMILNASYRAILWTTSHMVFSAICWFYYGKWVFWGLFMIDKKNLCKIQKIMKLVKKIPFLPRKYVMRSYYMYLLAKWVFLATLFHAIYNWLLTHQLAYGMHLWWAALLLFFLSEYLLYLLSKGEKTCDYGNIKQKIEFSRKVSELRNLQKNLG